MGILVSVIIPVYNAEKTIKRCIVSVMEQTYREVEILIINDGSTDKTSEILNTFYDDRIRIYNQENRGVSATRNLGVNLANGKYICFVDSDDLIDENYIECLVNLLEDDTLVSCGMKEIKNGNIIYRENRKCTYNNKNELLNDFENSFKNSFFNSVCGKLYIKEKIKVPFDDSIQYGEDLIFNLNYFNNVNKFIITNNTYYKYIMDNNFLSVKLHENELHAIKKMQMYLMNFIGSNENAKLIVDLFLSNNLMAYLQKIMFDNSIVNKKEKVNEILIIYKNFKLENENKELKKLLNKEYLYIKIYFKVKKIYKKIRKRG